MSTAENNAVSMALASVRASLKRAPLFMAAVATAAGMASTEAHAWGNDYQNLGSLIGGEVAKSVAGGGYGPKAYVAGVIGQTIGRNMTAPLDNAAEEKRRMDQIQAQAREKAARDAVYEAERRKVTPNYAPAAASSRAANQAYTAISANMQSMAELNERLAREYAQRNGLRQR